MKPHINRNGNVHEKSEINRSSKELLRILMNYQLINWVLQFNLSIHRQKLSLPQLSRYLAIKSHSHWWKFMSLNENVQFPPKLKLAVCTRHLFPFFLSFNAVQRVHTLNSQSIMFCDNHNLCCFRIGSLIFSIIFLHIRMRCFDSSMHIFSLRRSNYDSCFEC